MSNRAQFFPGSGLHLRDFRDMPKHQTYNLLGPGGGDLYGPNFDGWTEINNRGIVNYTGFSTNVWKTILNVSGGPGWMSGIVCPKTPNSTDTIDVRVTLDGSVLTFSQSAESNSGLYIGHALPGNFFTTAGGASRSPNLNAARNRSTFDSWNGDSIRAVPVAACLSMGVSLVRFEQSLLVEIRASNGVGTTGDCHSGVLYQMRGG
jgi:hypothetical protein